ncbi:GNAT family N-acetyltransferase [Bacillus weihaiensis]|uniref:N-acetyltransferase domain-containing protein n=1 Tax=Bacillus weihaiensis TaxID=1547283 RepID=A0A1L3MX61_9BACI|nr:GNAT family N-acetyltransferase [Bacillus weihaiensis]APH06870.1 hypothetical protein A9C19_20555 [Bacillus weihaiensis]
MIIQKATYEETNTLLHLTIDVMGESTMGYAKTDINSGLNMFVPLLNSGSYYLIAKEYNEIAGWVLLGPDYNPINFVKTGSITSLFVMPSFRHMGLGETLMRKALQQLKTEGYEKVILNVYEGNPAKRLYEKVGFSPLSTVMELTI